METSGVAIGDYVTRKSYNNDIVFKVINIKDDIYYLKGAEVRLYADSTLSDLVKCEKPREEDFKDYERGNNLETDGDFFYLPGKIVHLDGDDYLRNRPKSPVIKGKTKSLIFIKMKKNGKIT